MKVTVSSINFAPDHAGIGVYSTDFPAYLAEAGDQVTMVTGFSYYPAWKKRKEDCGRLFASEVYQGIRVLRGYLYVPQKVSALRRMLQEASFCLFAFINLLRAGKPDVIVIFTPPFFLGFVALMASKIWRCPLVINIQDLPLDAALALGMIRKSAFSSFMLTLENWIYRRAALVVTISDTMLKTVLTKGVQPERTALIPNWIDVQKHSVRAPSGKFLAGQPQMRGRFTVAYAGNLGVKQGVDLLLKLAEAVKADARFWFFVIGDGADRPRLEEMAAKMGLTNVTFLPFMSQADYYSMLADVDLIFVAQRSGAGNNFFPSKLLGLMAQRKPLLVAADPDSELAVTISRSGFGLVSDYGDVAALRQSLETFATGEGRLAAFGDKGREAVARYDRSSVLKAWRDRIARLV
ncbi:MAG TPA: glycosyltransferase family 4 protein [Candidatus Limnocylindria bacterium]|jgi:colanic acid biosynthesis glycosyl transferase WcaI|nr:glycosyltransferase family 4 protein [Candidatus Limnocylindria bacterium]